jgi:hypothetical protein
MSDVSAMKCLRCQGELQPLGHETLVTGGSGPAAKFFFGQLAEMQEKNWVVSAYRCANCHHIELFDAG